MRAQNTMLNISYDILKERILPALPIKSQLYFKNRSDFLHHLNLSYLWQADPSALKWLCDNNIDGLNPEHFNWLNENVVKDLSVIKYLDDHNVKGYSKEVFDLAAAVGSLDVVKYLNKKRNKEGCTTNAMDQAAGNGRLDVLQFLHDNRQEGCTANALILALKGNHVETSGWLLANVFSNMLSLSSENGSSERK